MALTVDGKVFSWGEGDDGKLGHSSRMWVISMSKLSQLPAKLLFPFTIWVDFTRAVLESY